MPVVASSATVPLLTLGRVHAGALADEEEIAHRVKHMSGETGHVTLSDGSEREWFEEAK